MKENTLAARARELYRPGGVFGHKAVAKVLGVSSSSVWRWLDPRHAEANRLLSNASKRRRTGTCCDCGAQTSYNGHDGKAISARCSKCGAVELGLRRRGSGKYAKALLEFSDGERTISQIAQLSGLKREPLYPAAERLCRYGMLRHVGRGVYVVER